MAYNYMMSVFWPIDQSLATIILSKGCVMSEWFGGACYMQCVYAFSAKLSFSL